MAIPGLAGATSAAPSAARSAAPRRSQGGPPRCKPEPTGATHRAVHRVRGFSHGVPRARKDFCPNFEAWVSLVCESPRGGPPPRARPPSVQPARPHVHDARTQPHAQRARTHAVAAWADSRMRLDSRPYPSAKASHARSRMHPHAKSRCTLCGKPDTTCTKRYTPACYQALAAWHTSCDASMPACASCVR